MVNHKDGAPALLRNDTKTANHWIRLSLVGTRSNRDAVGALVTVELEEPRDRLASVKGEEVSNPPRSPALDRTRAGDGGPSRDCPLAFRDSDDRERLAADKSYRIVEPSDQTPRGTGDAFQMLPVGVVRNQGQIPRNGVAE